MNSRIEDIEESRKEEERRRKEEEKEKKKKEKFERMKELRKKRKEKKKKDKEKLKKLNEKRKKERQERRTLDKIIKLQEEGKEDLGSSAAPTPIERVLCFVSEDEAEKEEEKKKKKEEKKQIYYWKKECDLKNYSKFLEKKRDEEVAKEEDDEKKEKIKMRYNKRYKRYIQKDLDRIKKIHRGNFKKELKEKPITQEVGDLLTQGRGVFGLKNLKPEEISHYPPFSSSSPPKKSKEELDEDIKAFMKLMKEEPKEKTEEKNPEPEQ